jgi:hypothetical protein
LSRRSDGMMKRGCFQRKCRVALIAIAGRYSETLAQKKMASAAERAEAREKLSTLKPLSRST